MLYKTYCPEVGLEVYCLHLENKFSYDWMTGLFYALYEFFSLCKLIVKDICSFVLLVLSLPFATGRSLMYYC